MDIHLDNFTYGQDTPPFLQPIFSVGTNRICKCRERQGFVTVATDTLLTKLMPVIELMSRVSAETSRGGGEGVC